MVAFDSNIVSALVYILQLLVLTSEANDDESIYFTATQLYAELLRELIGAHLRISASHLPSSMTIQSNPDGTAQYTGYIVDACDYMAQAFGFNYSFIETRSDEVKKIGIKEAAIRMLLRNEIDMASSEMIFNADILSRISVSIPLYATGPALLVPWPGTENRLLVPLRVFDPLVWLAVFVALVPMTFTLALVPTIYNKLIKKSTQLEASLVENMGDAGFSICANLTSHQGTCWKLLGKQIHFRILLGSWCLAAFVLVTAYSSVLISLLTLPKLMPASETFDDVTYGRTQKLRLIAENNGYIASVALTATSGRNKLLGDSFRGHPETLFNTPEERFDLMYTGKYAYAATQYGFNTLLDALNKKAGYCRFTASTRHMTDVREVHIVFGFPKNWRYSDAIRNKMQCWTDSGLAIHWIKSHQPRDKGCLLEDYKKNAAKQRVLTLVDLSSAFVVLALGYGVSLLVFLLEICYRKNLFLLFASRLKKNFGKSSIKRKY